MTRMTEEEVATHLASLREERKIDRFIGTLEANAHPAVQTSDVESVVSHP